MTGLLSYFLHPLISLNLWSDDDTRQGVDIIYPLTAFFAFGIWIVLQKYDRANNSAKHFEVSIPKPADPKWESIAMKNPNLKSHLEVDNAEIAPAMLDNSRDYITCYDPASSLHLITVLADNKDDIQRKIAAASVAQKKWKYTTFAERKRVVRSLKKWLVENQELCAKVACRDTGKTLIDAALGEILTTCSKMDWLLKHGERILSPEKRSSTLMLSYKSGVVHFEPLGVVAALVSWNYPLHNAWSPILAAIFAGNGIVLKCSENVVWSTSWFVEVIQSCLRACGHDPELVQLVSCYPDQAEHLTKSPMIKHITFIGSDTVGKLVALAAAENLTPVTLELGGKDPAIILPNTDLNRWASIWMRGIFQNSGQNCIGIERLIVHEDQHQDLHDILQERIEKLRLGSVMAPSDEGYITPVDCGAMISRDRFEGLERLLKDAEDAGASRIGGEGYRHVYLPDGAYFRPGLVGDVNSTMDIARQELFAPLALLMPYGTVDEAIQIANGTKYGLGASVFGPDQDDCVKVAKQLDCGMVSINDFGVFYVQDLPFGGTKASGYGRFGGPEGLRALTNPKAIIVDRWPSFIQTSIPKVVDYPVRSLQSSWQFTDGLVRFFYADEWRTRIRGLIALMRVNK